MENKLKFAVLGYGHIGTKHAEMISQNPDCENVAIIDTKFSTEETKFSDLIPKFSSLESFLKSEIPVDIIVVCTPNGLHFKQSEAILNSGINVIVEKPIALDSAEAEILEALAKKKNLQLFPVMQNRFSPPAVWLRSLIDTKVLGKIFMVQISCYWNRNDKYYTSDSWRGTKSLDGGTLYTQFSHFLDILYWLFGDITNIRSKFADYNHTHLTDFEDSGIITFDFLNGGMGSFNFSTSVWNENLESSLTIIAENGSVKIGGQYMNDVEKCIIKDYQMPNLAETNKPNDYGNFKGSAQNHQYLYENIVKVMRFNEKLEITPYESIQVIKMIENIYSKNSDNIKHEN
ncbi:Gfo/Idh/MocA family protein [Halpernia frigidisoli]|uniref:Predicted dehydrogenase n=1 Tax=Halpernia frigidisoli TaxID=1125876 RepID=A0A1I3FCD8_9FLAO|nr:Gfo/Idh/MocA family oxidoreductase [Halpernia frigidisoli]SFI08814.1 Predicted dehydrogenase [Halpernia frigidisoli]